MHKRPVERKPAEIKPTETKQLPENVVILFDMPA
jgi:hypothetical protein